jgi:hypothetical protein
MTSKKISVEGIALALNEAVAIFATEGVVVIPRELERALMRWCGLDNPDLLLEHSGTSDIIVHLVDWDSLPRRRSP